MHIIPLDQTFVEAVRAGGADANGQPAERAISDGDGIPCRSCLNHVPAGAPYLVLAARPFPAPQPYAETGPTFLCAAACRPWRGEGLPPILTSCPEYLVRGYTADHRILYGSGDIVGRNALKAELSTRLDDPAAAFVDLRSASNGCFQARAVRGGLTLICDNTGADRNNRVGMVLAGTIEQPAGRPRCPVP